MKIKSKKSRLKANRPRNSLRPTIYVVPVSGGKDSQKVLSDAVRAYGAENVRAVHHFTGFDHPLTMEHLDYMQTTYGVRIEHTVNPKYKDMFELLDKKNMIPGRIARFCTDELKIQAFNHWLRAHKHERKDMMVLMGMRAGESQNRATAYSDFDPKDTFSLRDLNPHKVWAENAVVRTQLPIVNLSTQQVFDSLKERGEKVNPLYGRGHKRVGCYPCILAGVGDYVMAARDPIGRQNVIMLRDFKDMIAAGHEGKYAPEVIIPHDIDAILDRADNDPFNFYKKDEDDEAGAGCQWCSQ